MIKIGYHKHQFCQKDLIVSKLLSRKCWLEKQITKWYAGNSLKYTANQESLLAIKITNIALG